MPDDMFTLSVYWPEAVEQPHVMLPDGTGGMLTSSALRYSAAGPPW